MSRALRRLLVRLGLLPARSYLCQRCEFEVPAVGTRWQQAGVAFVHWETHHEHERQDARS